MFPNNDPRLMRFISETRKMRSFVGDGAVDVSADDTLVIVNKASGIATTVNLPSNFIVGKQYTIKDGKGDANTNNITVTVPSTAASGLIDGAGSYVMSVNYQSATFIHNGLKWNIL